jgi:hypothetical protein
MLQFWGLSVVAGPMRVGKKTTKPELAGTIPQETYG